MVNWNPGSLSKISYNTHANPDTPWNYPSGTALTMYSVSRAHMRTYGADSTGLVRWTWVRLEGLLNTFATYISAYKACENAAGITSTWNQHVCYFTDKGHLAPNPRIIFDDNLIIFLQRTLRKGDNIVPGIDMNEDVRSGKLAKQLKGLGLIDLILSTHLLEPPPATFNSNNGRIPIDALWATPSIKVTGAGFGPVDGLSPSAKSDGH